MSRLQVPVTALPVSASHITSPLGLWRQARETIRTQPDFVRIVVNTLLYGLVCG